MSAVEFQLVLNISNTFQFVHTGCPERVFYQQITDRCQTFFSWRFSTNIFPITSIINIYLGHSRKFFKIELADSFLVWSKINFCWISESMKFIPSLRSNLYDVCDQKSCVLFDCWVLGWKETRENCTSRIRLSDLHFASRFCSQRIHLPGILIKPLYNMCNGCVSWTL